MITPAYSPTATERVLPRMALDFTTASLDSRVTVTRALNTATRVNASGSIEVVNADLPRFDFDPSTLVCKGLLIEETRTNGITNNTATGAVAGSPGTAPTNWFPTSTGGVFTRTIVGTGTENGIAYVDIRYQASGAGNASVQPIGGTTVVASNGQTWTYSSYVKLVGGSLANVTVNDTLAENSAGGAFLAGGDSANYVPTAASLISQRRAYTRTNTNALTAFVFSRTRVAFSGAGDVTLRFGLPQLELGAFATSVVQTSAGAVTRNADVVSMTGTNFSSWYQAGSGTLQAIMTRYAVATGFPRIASLSDNTANNEIAVVAFNPNPGTGMNVVNGGAPQASTFISLTGNEVNMALRYGTNDFAISLNSSNVTTDTVGTVPTVNQMLIGTGPLTSSPICSGWYKKIFFYNNRLINNELRSVSKL